MKHLFTLHIFLFLFSFPSVCNAVPIDKDTVYIDKEIASMIAPKMKKWLGFYGLNVTQFLLIREPGFDYYAPGDTASIHYTEYSDEDDFYDPQLYDYSPNKMLYLDLLPTSGVYREENGKCYYFGGDDCQEIYLVDRHKKQNKMILWNGTGAFSEAVFWINNDIFVIAQHDHGYTLSFHLFDLKNNSTKYYEYEIPIKEIRSYYFNEINLKERNILTSEYD